MEHSTRISLNSKVLTKVRQLCSNQKLTANCYQKLTAKCYQKFQSKVDSEMLSKVPVKSPHQKFQSKVDTESFSQMLTAKCNAKIVREVALGIVNKKQIMAAINVTRIPLYLRQKVVRLNSQAHTTRRPL